MTVKRTRRAALWITDRGLDQTDTKTEDLYAGAHEQLKEFARRQGIDPESMHNTREYQHTTMPNITIVEASFYENEDENQ